MKQDTAQYQETEEGAEHITKRRAHNTGGEMKARKYVVWRRMVSVSGCCWPCVPVSLVIQSVPPSQTDTVQIMILPSLLLTFVPRCPKLSPELKVNGTSALDPVEAQFCFQR